MRLETIQKYQLERSQTSQPLYPGPEQPLQAKLPTDFRVSLKRRLIRQLGRFAFPISARRFASQMPEIKLPHVTHIHPGYRFTEGWFQSQVQRFVKPTQHTSVLLPGCDFNSREVRDWLSEGVGQVTMLDIVDWGLSFESAKSQLHSWYCPKLSFVHGTLDSIPLPDETFDLMVSRAVLEHVGNMEDSVREMARVLRPGGIAIHCFGPLYCVFGGDHTIGSYGFERGFDHLLLDEAEYQHRIHDGDFYKPLGVMADHSRYWALHGIFSYLRPAEYLDIFAKHFEIVVCVAVASEESLEFRSQFPAQWRQMLDAGMLPQDLLIGSMQVILRKPTTGTSV